MWPFKPKITKEQARTEIHEMVEAYKKVWPNWKYGFLVGSSLVNNHKQGDSARFWELKKIIDL